VLAAGPSRKAHGHLEIGVATALTYRLRIPDGIDAACRAMAIANELGDELLWAGAAEACAWHTIVGGELAAGLDRVERAFEVADRHQRSFLAWMGSNMSGELTWGLGSPDEARAFYERPLGLPYVGRTAYRRQIADGVGRCHASTGEPDAARARLPDARPTWITHSLKPLLDLWDGRLDDVAALAARVLETSRRTGNRWDEWASYHLTARVQRLRGELEDAAARLEQALPIVVEGGAAYFELWVRADLARVRAETGALEAARAHAERCREITGNGEDWRGRAGHAALADAVVLAAEDRTDEAGTAFGSALETFARYRLRGDEADALHQWGLALARAGADREAAERLEQALEIYRDHGAGPLWLERVEADRRRLRAARR
jgi:tetratricopeptide (TPR) repeat protein